MDGVAPVTLGVSSDVPLRALGCRAGSLAAQRSDEMGVSLAQGFYNLSLEKRTCPPI